MTEALREMGFEVADSSSNFILAACKNCKASDVYDKLIEQNILKADAKAYYQLFNLWYHAKEMTHAQRALAKSAKLSQNGEHFISKIINYRKCDL